MKKIFISGILFLIYISSYSQNLDLIVTVRGDSIACKIDSISDSAIFFKLKTHGSNKWMHTFYEKENIVSYKYNCIDPSEVSFKKGTSIIASDSLSNKEYPKKFPDKASLEKASTDELDFYLNRAQTLKKAGAGITIAGAALTLTGVILISLNREAVGYFGIYMSMIGIPVTIIGLPILITGSSRINKIKKIKNSISDAMFLDVSPCVSQNKLTQNFQTGISLCLRF